MAGSCLGSTFGRFLTGQRPGRRVGFRLCAPFSAHTGAATLRQSTGAKSLIVDRSNARSEQHHDPWPIIEAIRAPSWEIVERAAGLGISVKGWVKGSSDVVERARSLFPDHSPLKVGLVVLSAGLVCARTEFEVTAVVGRMSPGLSSRSTGFTIDDFWPEGVSAAREHMVSLLRLEALDPQLLGTASASSRAARDQV